MEGVDGARRGEAMSREVEEMENLEMRRGAYSARRAEATVEDSVPRCTAHGK